MAFIRRNIEELQINPVTMIGKEWFLLTSGTPEDFNTMTCSWGGIGVLWNAPVLTAYVRTTRHTFGYLEKNDRFTVSVFPEEYRKALAFCGGHSGRDCDKVKETGLTPAVLDGVPAFAEAKLVFVCEKVYAQMLSKEDFVRKELLNDFYAKDAMHKMYLGKITAVYEKQA